jgi:hypothetical protein
MSPTTTTTINATNTTITTNSVSMTTDVTIIITIKKYLKNIIRIMLQFTNLIRVLPYLGDKQNATIISRLFTISIGAYLFVICCSFFLTQNAAPSCLTYVTVLPHVYVHDDEWIKRNQYLHSVSKLEHNEQLKRTGRGRKGALCTNLCLCAAILDVGKYLGERQWIAYILMTGQLAACWTAVRTDIRTEM